MPVRTTSRWPCATRRAISASTASAARLRDAPRTSGITQKLHEKLQPSCTLTKARTRSRRASAWTHPIAPTSPATKSGVSSLRRATTTTLSGRPSNASAARFAPHPVTYTRACVRAARGACAVGIELDAVGARVGEGDADRVVVDVDRHDRPEAELCRGDREHSRPTADVEQASRLDLLQQLEREPRRRMRAGPEGAARVDHDRRHVVGRLFPGRPDPEAPDDDPVVELTPG